MILPANPGAQYQAHREQIDQAIRKVLDSGWYILGDSVKEFERAFAHYIGVSECVGVANGTDAVALALRGCGIGPGDEVITVSHSAVATVAAIEMIGAVPVFVDIEPSTRCMDPQKIAAQISPRTRAIVPVHIYGQPARIEEILHIARTHSLKVIEDCAQAHGAMVGSRRVGSFGDAAAFSFYPTKNLGAIGDGGAVVTNLKPVAESVRMLQQYGWKSRYVSDIAGVNSRLDELQAAILSVKLPYLDQDNARRRAVAERYRASIDGERLQAPPVVEDTTHAMHLFVVECPEREAFRDFLTQQGVGTSIQYPFAIHQQPAYQGRIRSGALVETETLYERVVSLPMFPELAEVAVDQVCQALREWQSK